MAPGGAVLVALALDCLNRSGVHTAPARRIAPILQLTSARAEPISLGLVLPKITLGATQWSRVGEKRAGGREETVPGPGWSTVIFGSNILGFRPL